MFQFECLHFLRLMGQDEDIQWDNLSFLFLVKKKKKKKNLFFFPLPSSPPPALQSSPPPPPPPALSPAFIEFLFLFFSVHRHAHKRVRATLPFFFLFYPNSSFFFLTFSCASLLSLANEEGFPRITLGHPCLASPCRLSSFSFSCPPAILNVSLSLTFSIFHFLFFFLLFLSRSFLLKVQYAESKKGQD